jgi:glycosyltransferase involved in cell wall biosynthesis
MRIAIITSSYPVEPGSFAGHFVAAEARQLYDAGHRVTVCAPGFEGDRQVDGIAVHGCGAVQLFRSPGALPRLSQHPQLILQALSFVQAARRWLREQPPFEAIQAHWLLPCGWPIATDSTANIEIVCHGSDVELLHRLPRFVTRSILRKVVERDGQLRCVSAGLKRKLLKLDPSLEPRITVRPAALQIPPTPDRSLAREQLGLPARGAIIVIIARLVPTKRVDVALDELSSLLHDTSNPPQVIVIGEGPERTTLERRFPFAQFLGELPRDRALLWLASADLLLSASQLEGAPTVVREARALKVPVVSAIAGDLEQWAQQDTGIHLFRDPGELKVAVACVLSQRGA